MPTYREETQKEHMEAVREVMALYPRAGAIRIREILQKRKNNPITLDPHYILKLKKKIAGERKHRFNQAIVDEHIAEMEDTFNELIIRMWQIVLDPNRDERARVSAAKVIMDSKLKLFEAKMNAGIFERKLGTIEVKNAYEIKSEQKVLILNALANFGIIPPIETNNNGNNQNS